MSLTSVATIESLIAGALPAIMQAVPLIQSAYSEAVSDDDFITKLQKEGGILTQGLEAFGSYLIPGLSGPAAVITGSLAAANPDIVKFGQGVLNTLQAAGKISFGTPLVVDGIPGPKTFAAVQALQKALNLPTTGVIGQVEQAAFTLLANNVTLPKL